MSKTVIIGLDGVPFGLIKDFADSGIMPNTASLLAEGTFKPMASSIPEVSSVAWSSIITGANPAEHGIFGFTDLAPYSYELRFPNFSDLKCRPFWDSQDRRYVIMNVPSTYPVRPLRGVHISGFVSIDMQRSVYPPSLIPELRQLDYRLDVDSQKAHQCMDDFLVDLDQTLQARIRAYRLLWNSQKWQTFMLVFTGTDRLMHFLWEAYEQPNHQYHDAFLDHFRRIDAVIGEISDKLGSEDLLIMLSDHGFERLDSEIHINWILRKEGFLKLKSSQQPSPSDIVSPTKAFALDPARIYINRKGKYPQGFVNEEDTDSVLRDLEALFDALEVSGQKVVKDVYRKEDIYSGPLLEQAPDLVLVANPHFDLKATMKATELAQKGIFTGKHTQDTAFLLVRGRNTHHLIPQDPQVFCVRSIIEMGTCDGKNLPKVRWQ